MAVPEYTRYSFVRASRDVHPSRELKILMAKVGRIGIRAFDPSDTTWLRPHDDLDEQLRPGYIPEFEGIDISGVESYKPSQLRLTQFERKGQPTTKLNGAYGRLATKMNAAENFKQELFTVARTADVGDANSIPLRITGITPSRNSEYAHLGEELAFNLAPSSVVDMLRRQNELIHSYVISRTGAGTNLDRAYHEPAVTIPFVRLPFEAEVADRENFIDWAQDSIPRTGLDIRLGELRWINIGFPPVKH